MSVIFSVVRVIPHDNRSKLRKVRPDATCNRNIAYPSQITNCLAAIFAVFWIGLMIQVANVCGANKSWYKFAKPQCRLGDGVAAFELTSTSARNLRSNVGHTPITLYRRRFRGCYSRDSPHRLDTQLLGSRCPAEVRIIFSVHELQLMRLTRPRMLYVIFAASLLTTIASIVHAIFLIGPSGSLEGTAAQAEVRLHSFISRTLF
jgi:hypothetical protein